MKDVTIMNTPDPQQNRGRHYQNTIHRLRMEELVLAVISVVLIISLVICGIVINNLNQENKELTAKLQAAQNGTASSVSQPANPNGSQPQTSAPATSTVTSSTVSTTPPPPTSWTDTDEDGYEWHDFSDDSSWYDEQAMTARLVDRYGEGSYWRVFEV